MKLPDALNLLSTRQALALGIGAGVLLGIGWLYVNNAIIGSIGFMLFLGLAAWLTLSGDTVAVFEEPIPEQEPSLPDVNLVDIPADSFLIGDTGIEINISAFQCMRVPVTRRLYQKVKGEDPGWPDGGDELNPINRVNWFNAVKFCNQLSELANLEPCYEIKDKLLRIVGNSRLQQPNSAIEDSRSSQSYISCSDNNSIELSGSA